MASFYFGETGAPSPPKPDEARKPLSQSMTVRSAAAVAIAFGATLIAKWSGVEVSPDLQQAILVLGGCAIAYFMRRGVESAKAGR